MNTFPKVKKLKTGHRVAIILAAATLSLFFAASSGNELLFSFGGKIYNEAKVNTIIEALQKEDADSIMSLFSKTAIKEAGEDEIEDGIRYLYTVFKGKVQSVEALGGDYSEHIDGLRREKKSFVLGLVTTDINSYRIYGSDTIYDSFNRNNVGFRHLMVLRDDDFNRFGFPAYDFVGVFRQDIIEAAYEKYPPNKDSIEKVLEILENNDAETLAGMFSQRAINEVGADKIKAGSEYSCDVIDGNIETWDSSNANTETNIIDGKVRMILYMYCIVKADGKRYTVYYREILIDETSPENVGIDRMKVQLDTDGSGRWLLKGDALGIFCRNEDDPRKYTSWKADAE